MGHVDDALREPFGLVFLAEVSLALPLPRPIMSRMDLGGVAFLPVVLIMEVIDGILSFLPAEDCK